MASRTVTVSLDVPATANQALFEREVAAARSKAHILGAKELGVDVLNAVIDPESVTSKQAASQEGAPRDGVMVTLTYEVTTEEPSEDTGDEPEEHPMISRNKGIVYDDVDLFEVVGIQVAERAEDASLARESARLRIEDIARAEGVLGRVREAAKLTGPFRLGAVESIASGPWDDERWIVMWQTIDPEGSPVEIDQAESSSTSLDVTVPMHGSLQSAMDRASQQARIEGAAELNTAPENVTVQRTDVQMGNNTVTVSFNVLVK